MNFNKVDFYKAFGEISQLSESEGLEIAFSGRSNVGKSSLINKLLNRKALARVSAVPGKTATINFYTLDDIFLVDLPGYGYAKIAKSDKQRWASLIEGYLTDDRRLGLVIQLVDFRHPPTEDDVHMLNFMIDYEIPFIIVLTKADKLNKNERIARREALKTELDFISDVKTVEFSAQTGEGVDELKRIIEEVSYSEKEE